jgi:1,4-dihydroxy-6-naphthoate synthase
MSSDSRPVLQIGHSPDPDDAFMWWPLAPGDSQAPRIETGRFRYRSVLADIETLNQWSTQGSLEITAMSCAQYPYVRDRYAITACGSSMGDGFGPKLVARKAMTIDELRKTVIAVPGERTSAFAAANLLLGPKTFRYQVVPFEHIIRSVAGGEFDAGLVIHEGQLTFQQSGLHLIADLGEWWTSTYKLPLPLGINGVRLDLETEHGPGTLEEIASTLLRSVEYALDHRPEGLEIALQFGRGIASELADRFISMYVNRWTLDFGPVGHEAVRTFLNEIHRAGLTPPAGVIDFVGADQRCSTS